MRCLDALLPALAGSFGCRVGSAGAAVSAYALSYSAFQLLHGRLGDRAGPYKVITIAACLSAIVAAGCAFAPTLITLVAMRFAAGSVAAAIGPLTLAWLSVASSPSERSVALARMTGAVILGTAAGQVGGGIIGGLFGWRAMFVLLSTMFAVSGAALIVIGSCSRNVRPLSPPAVGRPVVRPGLLSLLRRSSVRLVILAVSIEAFALYLSLTYVGGLLHDRLLTGPSRAGLLLSFFGAGGVAFVLSAGPITRRSTRAVRSYAAGIILGVGFASLGLCASETGAAVSLFALGFGFLALHNVLQVMASEMAPDALSASLALFAAASTLAQALGAAAGGYTFDRVGPALPCLVSATMLTVLGTALSVMGRPRRATAKRTSSSDPDPCDRCKAA